MPMNQLGTAIGAVAMTTCAAPLLGETVKQLSVPIKQAAATQAVVALENLPPEMIKMHTGDGWQSPQRTSGPRAGVTRVALPMQNCRQPADNVDLRRARMNGFTVVSYRLEEAPGPRGYKQAAGAVRC